MATTNINVRVDSKLKADAETLFSDLGITESPLKSVGLRQMRKHALPWPNTPR